MAAKTERCGEGRGPQIDLKDFFVKESRCPKVRIDVMDCKALSQKGFW